MSAIFPSAGWFRRLGHCMAAQREKYRKLGAVELTLVPRITFPDGHAETFSVEFEGDHCRAVEQLDDVRSAQGRHPLILEGDYGAWKEMIENIHVHGHADVQHRLDHLTQPEWSLRVVAADGAEGQLDVDRFHRYSETLQEFFDESSRIETRFLANGG